MSATPSRGHQPLSLPRSRRSVSIDTSPLSFLWDEIHRIDATERQAMKTVTNILNAKPSTHCRQVPDVSSSSSLAAYDTVNPQKVWCSPRVQPQSIVCNDCKQLLEEVTDLRSRNAALESRCQQLQRDLDRARSHEHQSPSPRPQLRNYSSVEISNVLLHDSTHRLLAEAEGALLGKDFSSSGYIH